MGFCIVPNIMMGKIVGVRSTEQSAGINGGFKREAPEKDGDLL